MIIILVDFDLVMHSHIMGSFLTCLRMCVCHVKHIQKAHAALVLKCLFGLSSAFHSASDDVGFIIQKKSLHCFPGNKKPRRHQTCAVHQPVHVCGDWEKNFRWPSALNLVIWAFLLLLYMYSWCFREDFWVTLNGTLYCSCVFRSLWDFSRWFTPARRYWCDSLPPSRGASVSSHNICGQWTMSGIHFQMDFRCAYFKNVILMGWYNDFKWH